MQRLQLLSFEIGRTCNLAADHPWCPVNFMARPEGEISDVDILVFAGACQTHGFRGLIAWHYYNEPMLEFSRVIRLSDSLREIGLPSGLWTNGSLIDPDDLSWVQHFSRIWITLHDPERREIYRKVEEAAPGRVTIVPGDHDSRLQAYSAGEISCPDCWRPLHLELIIDNGGEAHICCADWKAESWIGNIRKDHADMIYFRWKAAAIKASCGLMPVCRRCARLEKSPALLDKEFRL